MEGSESQV